MTTGLIWFDDARQPAPAGQLSRERVVAAAIALADTEPSGEITMRAVAASLGARSPMALYRYVGSKNGLLDLMADHAYGLMDVPSGQGWRSALHGLGVTGWAAIERHPWAARLAYSRPPLGPNALCLFDAALAELEPLGLDAATRMGFINAVLGHVLGSGLALLEERAMRARTGLAEDKDLAGSVEPYLQHIAETGQHPHFTRWATDPRRHEQPPQSFERTLDWILDGLATLSRK